MNVEQPEAATSQERLLIVDDTQTNVAILTTILSKRGYQVQSASNGITALELIQTTPPDLILLDILMPEITGYEVCKRLKADQRTCHIPIIFISALEKGSDRVKAFAVGGADFISKPFYPQEVLARIEHQLQIIRLQRELNQQKEQLIGQNQQLQRENEERERALLERQQVEKNLTQTTSRLSALIANLQAGVLVEDEFRRIVLVNQAFCHLVRLEVSPDALIGADCSQIAAQSKSLFADPDRAIQRIDTILQQRQVVVAEEVLLADGRTLERDYIPILSKEEYQGHLWQYRDITARKVSEIKLQYQLQRILLLQQMTEAIRSEIEPQQMFETAVQQIGRTFQASRCIIYAYVDSPMPELAWVSEYIKPGCNSVWEVEIPVEGNPHAIQILSQDEAIASPDVYLDPWLGSARFICHRIGLKSLLAVRTSNRGQPNGMIALHQCDRFRTWTTDEITLFEAIAAQVGIAFAQAHLLEQEKKQREALDYQNTVLRQEIRNRKRLEKELAQSQQFLHSIVENIPLALFVKDAQNDLRYVLWNRAAEIMYGSSREEVIGRNSTDLLEPSVAAQYDEEDRQLIAGIQPLFIRDEKFYSASRQSTLQQRIIKVPLVDEHNAVTHLLCIAEDISDRKRQEDEMRRAREAADAANKAKSEFLAHMSHELRTPLNTILGFTQLIARECTLDPQASDYLNIISRSGEHLLNLINDVLEMSKIEAGGTSLHRDRFDLCALLQSLEDMLRFKAESKGLRLTFQLAEDLPHYVQTDEGKLRQVLINLLGNAIKFTQEGQVSLRVSLGKRSTRRSQPIAQNAPLSASDLLQFEVEDTGPGINPIELDRLFRPFLQTETGQKSQEGTGLGLPISQHFVRLMGGEITVNSTVGQGSIFRFAIQIQAVEAIGLSTPPSTRAVIALALDQEPFRILVVEDHWANRRLLVKMLTGVGFEVAEAQNGQEAIALAASWQPHLIWMDIRMPLLDGYEATRQIKASSGTQSPIIIALTASAFEEDRTKVLEAGCDDFVRKPFRRDLILNKIADFLNVRYRYEDQPRSQTATPPRSALPPEGELRRTTDQSLSLQVMPPTWIESLEQAAVIGSDTLLLQLIEQIPPTHSRLVTTLTRWTKNFDFDQVIELIQRNRA